VHNASLDQLRFLSPPTVTIGGSACKDVVVLSATQLQCTAPSHVEGKVDVVVTPTDGSPATITGGYEYVNASAMTVTGVNPNIGPSFGGTYIKIIGNNFGEGAENIASVTVGGETCADTTAGVTNSTTQYYCILPEVDISESTFVDVVVTDKSGGIYELKQSFEYVKVSKEPISANVQ
jgi:hypothetical protein